MVRESCWTELHQDASCILREKGEMCQISGRTLSISSVHIFLRNELIQSSMMQSSLKDPETKPEDYVFRHHGLLWNKLLILSCLICFQTYKKELTLVSGYDKKYILNNYHINSWHSDNTIDLSLIYKCVEQTC